MSKAVASPCIGICQVDAHQRCCGCGRTLGEIAEWASAKPQRQREIIAAAKQRLSDQPSMMPPP